MNLILGDVEETIYVVDINEENGQETVRVSSSPSINCSDQHSMTRKVRQCTDSTFSSAFLACSVACY